MPELDVDGVARQFGWIPDLPDRNDYSIKTPVVETFRKKAKVPQPAKSGNIKLPASCSLHEFCSDVRDQQTIGSCCGQSGVANSESAQLKEHGRYVSLSPLFLYKLTRKLMGLTGDTGASLRDTMKALVIFGVPPEEVWKYIIGNFDAEPTSYAYGYAQSFQSLKYYRHDMSNIKPDEVVDSICSNLVAGFTSMMGFPVYQSINQANKTGEIPFPAPGERLQGGHAVEVIGFDFSKTITNTRSKQKTTGAFEIKNSWGNWGQSGFGWVPIQFVLERMARDWWSILDQEWVNFGVFA